MKKIAVLAGVISLVFAASCGGGGGGGGTPTSTETQVAAAAATKATIEAGGQAILNALQQFAGAQVVKASVTNPVNYTDNCEGEGGGSYTATGTVTADCIETVGAWTCTVTDGPVSVVFTDCMKSVTIDGTTYNEVLNGTAGTNVTGTISGTEEGPTAINAAGTLDGTVTLTGDAPGTADLSEVTWTATGSLDPEPTIGCGGTAVVEITGQAAQNCQVLDDCSGCEQ